MIEKKCKNYYCLYIFENILILLQLKYINIPKKYTIIHLLFFIVLPS